MIRPLLCAFALILALPRPALAEVLEISGATLIIPPGWTYEEKGKNRQLTRAFPEAEDGRGKGMATILIVGPLPEAPARFDANFDVLRNTMPEMQDEDPLLEAKGQTTAGHYIRIDETCCQRREGLRFDQATVGIAAGNRHIYFMMLSVGLRGENADQADADFASLVRGLRLKPDDPDFGLRPAPGDGGLEGVYTHLATGLQVNVFGGMDFTAESEILTFDPGGLFSTELPTGGRDLAAFCAETPRPCGTYGTNDGQITLRKIANDYGMLEVETLPFAKDGDDLLIDGASHRHLDPFPANTRLQGSWSHTWAVSGTGAGFSGSMASGSTLLLHQDGRFERSGWYGGSTSNAMADTAYSGDRAPETGYYRIDGHSLRLQGTRTGEETLSIFAPDEGSAELLVIDGVNYLKN